jgi:signal transduction histidine kinase
LAEDPATEPAVLEDAVRQLAAETAALLDQEMPAGGETDLPALLAELQHAFETQHNRVQLVVETPPTARAAVRPELLQVLLYELLSNAAEALTGQAGTVSVIVGEDAEDIHVDVLDNGPGIAVAPGSEYRLFRAGVSTRGQDRGRGLHVARELARRAGGEMVLQARSASHPVLRGAHFRLVLPRQP